MIFTKHCYFLKIFKSARTCFKKINVCCVLLSKFSPDGANVSLVNVPARKNYSVSQTYL